MKKLMMITMGVLLLASIVIAATQIERTITLDKLKKDKLKDAGIDMPIISECLKIDDFSCESNIYEKDGINKKIKITTKYCDTYEIIYSDGECLEYSYSEEQGECIGWLDENQTECLEYRIIQIQGECINYEVIESYGNCSNWKILNQLEIENELINKTNILLENIVNVKIDRIKIKDTLTDEIKIKIKEK